MAELAAWWLDVVALHRVGASTLGTYSQRVERITNTIGLTPGTRSVVSCSSGIVSLYSQIELDLRSYYNLDGVDGSPTGRFRRPSV